MATMPADFPETISPTPADTELARESSRRLSKILGRHPAGSGFPNFRLRVKADDEPEEVIVIPSSAFRLLTRSLS